MKWWSILLILFSIVSFNGIQAENETPPIVFVHIGSTLPPHLESAICQACLFNESSEIFLIASEEALSLPSRRIHEQSVIFVPYEKLPLSSEHRLYQLTTRSSGLWRYATERFLYLYDLMKERNLHHVFHLENDNMLYADLTELLPVFKQFYPGIAATFDNDARCIAGFMYISNPQSMQSLAEFFSIQAWYGYTDMHMIALYKNRKTSEVIDHLPIICPSYSEEHPLISDFNHQTNEPQKYSNHFMAFASIFDAAAIGQYLGGLDVYLKNRPYPGFINESCLFNPSYLSYVWELDEKGRRIPYAIFKNEKFRINNLHIHSKLLYQFAS